ncbi:hypothetical protein Y032_0004g2193 [Ancylostoma ceylanicum]|uniref:Uncharacterized protein n=1 Tax=Ancylostoma ceylanicum TaxID=53326 RepID=A0A016VVA0_9BILA|nr:hypothetical protein Y032_0004g2193 [Ancylostoma ceylanicum]
MISFLDHSVICSLRQQKDKTFEWSFSIALREDSKLARRSMLKKESAKYQHPTPTSGMKGFALETIRSYIESDQEGNPFTILNWRHRWYWIIRRCTGGALQCTLGVRTQLQFAAQNESAI